MRPSTSAIEVGWIPTYGAYGWLGVMKRTRRSVGCIHLGHLPEEYRDEGMATAMEIYWNEIEQKDWSGEGYTAGAFAMEEAPSTGAIHIHFYVEHSQKAATTLCRQFGLTQPAVFYDTVRSARGSWDYCTGAGKHEMKEAMARFDFGTPTLWGGSENDASLKWCVDRILAGSHPTDILRENAYAYTVHRQRIWYLWADLTHLESHGRVKIPDFVRGR